MLLPDDDQDSMHDLSGHEEDQTQDVYRSRASRRGEGGVATNSASLQNLGDPDEEGVHGEAVPNDRDDHSYAEHSVSILRRAEKEFERKLEARKRQSTGRKPSKMKNKMRIYSHPESMSRLLRRADSRESLIASTVSSPLYRVDIEGQGSERVKHRENDAYSTRHHCSYEELVL